MIKKNKLYKATVIVFFLCVAWFIFTIASLIIMATTNWALGDITSSVKFTFFSDNYVAVALRQEHFILEMTESLKELQFIDSKQIAEFFKESVPEKPKTYWEAIKGNRS